MNRIALWLAAAALGVGLTACVPEFQNALEGGNPADPALIGNWSAKSDGDDDAMLLDIAVKGDGVSVILRDPKGGAEKLEFAGRTAEVNGTKYISLTPIDADAMHATRVDQVLEQRAVRLLRIPRAFGPEPVHDATEPLQLGGHFRMEAAGVDSEPDWLKIWVSSGLQRP